MSLKLNISPHQFRIVERGGLEINMSKRKTEIGADLLVLEVTVQNSRFNVESIVFGASDMDRDSPDVD